MLDSRTNKLKTQIIQIQEGNNQKSSYITTSKNKKNNQEQMQFGKPVKLPYILMRNNMITIDRRSIQDKQKDRSNQKTQNTRIVDRKKNAICNSSQIDLLTTLTGDELELLKNSHRKNDAIQHNSINDNQTSQHNSRKFTDSVGFPKLTLRISDKIQRLGRIKSQKNIPKIQSFQTINDYKIGSIIGRGTYAIVRKAKHLLSDKKYAIKTYKKIKISQNALTNLKREVNTLKILREHPNILKYEETIEDEQSINIVTELLENISLSDILKAQQDKKLNQKQCLKIMKQVLGGIQHIHSSNICHRDLKMENILINNSKVKIIDFGFSIEVNEKELLWQICGTPHYIAPQILMKKGYFGKPADVWSLGILFYRLIVGNFPFKAINQKAIYAKIMKGQFKIPSDIPKSITQIILKMLQPNPQNRPSIDQLLKNQWLNSSRP